jgi:large subunit ribosomal protein L30
VSAAYRWKSWDWGCAVASETGAGQQKLLRIKQVRSGSGRPAKHRRTLEALGLKKHQQTIVKQDNPAIRGMLFQVRHLVQVDEIVEGEA